MLSREGVYNQIVYLLEKEYYVMLREHQRIIIIVRTENKNKILDLNKTVLTSFIYSLQRYLTQVMLTSRIFLYTCISDII